MLQGLGLVFRGLGEEASDVVAWEGYALSELSVHDLRTSILKYTPYILFDVKPVLNVDQIMESIKKVSA